MRWPDPGSWGAAPQPGVSHSRRLPQNGGRRFLPTKGEVQEDTCRHLVFLTWTTARGPLGWALGRRRQRCWAVSAAHVARAAVPHLLRGKEARGQAETSCSPGLACRPQLVSAELAHPRCNCVENYLLAQDLYVLISVVWCGVCGYNRSHSKSSFCYRFESPYL